MNDAIPGEDVLLASIAAEARVEPDRVRHVLDEADVSLRPPLPAQRRITIRRFFVYGAKSGTHNRTDCPFEKDVMLGPGTWTIASREVNSAGKSSLLWGHWPSPCAANPMRCTSGQSRSPGSAPWSPEGAPLPHTTPGPTGPPPP